MTVGFLPAWNPKYGSIFFCKFPQQTIVPSISFHASVSFRFPFPMQKFEKCASPWMDMGSHQTIILGMGGKGSLGYLHGLRTSGSWCSWSHWRAHWRPRRPSWPCWLRGPTWSMASFLGWWFSPKKKLDDGWPESEKDVCQAALSIAAVKKMDRIAGMILVREMKEDEKDREGE